MSGVEEVPIKKPTGHTKDGIYVLPLTPVAEHVKRALGLPVRYLFAEKTKKGITYTLRQVP